MTPTPRQPPQATARFPCYSSDFRTHISGLQGSYLVQDPSTYFSCPHVTVWRTFPNSLHEFDTHFPSRSLLQYPVISVVSYHLACLFREPLRVCRAAALAAIPLGFFFGPSGFDSILCRTSIVAMWSLPPPCHVSIEVWEFSSGI